MSKRGRNESNSPESHEHPEQKKVKADDLSKQPKPQAEQRDGSSKQPEKRSNKDLSDQTCLELGEMALASLATAILLREVRIQRCSLMVPFVGAFESHRDAAEKFWDENKGTLLNLILNGGWDEDCKGERAEKVKAWREATGISPVFINDVPVDSPEFAEHTEKTERALEEVITKFLHADDSDYALIVAQQAKD